MYLLNIKNIPKFYTYTLYFYRGYQDNIDKKYKDINFVFRTFIKDLNK